LGEQASESESDSDTSSGIPTERHGHGRRELAMRAPTRFPAGRRRADREELVEGGTDLVAVADGKEGRA